MATIGNTVLTLADWAKRLDPDGKVAKTAELLSQRNEILTDMLYKEGNLPTGHRTTVRTGLPSVAWRILNQGVTPSKSTTAQIDEQCGMLEAWSEVDKELALLNGNTAEFRLSEAMAFLEAMNQQHTKTLFYGNTLSNPEQILGLAPRFSSKSAQNGQNIIDCAGTGSANTSVWLVVWGENTVHGIFPKGTSAGLTHNDHGEQIIQSTAGIGGQRMLAFQDQWVWKTGIALRDWRYVVRAANIDVPALTGGTGADLFATMTKMMWRIPSLQMGKAVFYVNRTVGEYLDLQAQGNVKAGGQLRYDEVAGKVITEFRKVPVRICDQLLSTEARVT